MGYFKKKRKERVNGSTRVINLLLPRILPPKAECLALRGNAKLSISSIYDLYSVRKQKGPPSLYDSSNHL